MNFKQLAGEFGAKSSSACVSPLSTCLCLSGSELPRAMEEPAGLESTPGLQELQADLARILSLLLSNEEVNRNTLAEEVHRFIEIYDPLRKNEVWMQQFSSVVASTYLVSVLVDRFEFFEPKPFLQMLLFCASFCTYLLTSFFRCRRSKAFFRNFGKWLENHSVY